MASTTSKTEFVSAISCWQAVLFGNGSSWCPGGGAGACSHLDAFPCWWASITHSFTVPFTASVRTSFAICKSLPTQLMRNFESTKQSVAVPFCNTTAAAMHAVLGNDFRKNAKEVIWPNHLDAGADVDIVLALTAGASSVTAAKIMIVDYGAVRQEVCRPEQAASPCGLHRAGSRDAVHPQPSVMCQRRAEGTARWLVAPLVFAPRLHVYFCCLVGQNLGHLSCCSWAFLFSAECFEPCVALVDCLPCMNRGSKDACMSK